MRNPEVTAPNPGRRHPKLLVSPPEMTQEQWEWVLDSDHHVYAAEATSPNGSVMTRWIGTEDWQQAAENYLTAPHGCNRTHTVTVWDTPDRTDTATIRWNPTMQADMDEGRAEEAKKRADSLARDARASRREATNPTPEAPKPTEEPLTALERELLEG